MAQYLVESTCWLHNLHRLCWKQVPLKCQYIYTRMHRVTSQKMVISSHCCENLKLTDLRCYLTLFRALFLINVLNKLSTFVHLLWLTLLQIPLHFKSCTSECCPTFKIPVTYSIYECSYCKLSLDQYHCWLKLIPWSRVLCGKLTVTQLVKYLAFYETQSWVNCSWCFKEA
jgi:hypothetical protein